MPATNNNDTIYVSTDGEAVNAKSGDDLIIDYDGGGKDTVSYEYFTLAVRVDLINGTGSGDYPCATSKTPLVPI